MVKMCLYWHTHQDFLKTTLNSSALNGRLFNKKYDFEQEILLKGSSINDVTVLEGDGSRIFAKVSIIKSVTMVEGSQNLKNYVTPFTDDTKTTKSLKNAEPCTYELHFHLVDKSVPQNRPYPRRKLCWDNSKQSTQSQ
jgi:hypothetical protein